jgi:hypothetical protein
MDQDMPLNPIAVVFDGRADILAIVLGCPEFMIISHSYQTNINNII